MKYGVLKQRNPEYMAEAWSELDALYKGGYAVTGKAAGDLLPKLVGENSARYEDRKKSAGYLGYLAQIIDRFVSGLFMGDLVVTEPGDATDPNTPGGTSDSAFYGAFAHDADLAGTPFVSVVRSVVRNALLKKRGIVAIDFPKPLDKATIATRADEDASGASRAYLFEVPCEQLLDWERDKFGNFRWAVLYRCRQERDTPAAVRGAAKVHEFKVWTLEGGVAVWRLFAFTETTDNKLLDETDFPVVDQGATGFEVIPLMMLELADGLWMGNKIGCIQREHHARRSALIAAMNKSLVAIPVAKLGPEIGAMGGPMPSEAATDPSRGNDPLGKFDRQGYVVIGAGDDIAFVEPAGSAYALCAQNLAELKDEMFRVVHQMAASLSTSPSAAGASGDSKREDREAEAVVLTYLGQKVREYAKKVYDVIARARAESVVWVVHGLDQFQSDDRATLLAEAVQMNTIAIPSATFTKEYKTQVALKLLTNAPPETQDVIRAEIADGVKADADMADVRRSAEKRDLLSPPAPGVSSAAPKKPFGGASAAT